MKMMRTISDADFMIKILIKCRLMKRINFSWELILKTLRNLKKVKLGSKFKNSNRDINMHASKYKMNLIFLITI